MFRAIILSLVALTQIARAEDKLEYVVVMSRHGVRSPLWTEAQQNAYSAQPWPTWNVPTGYLTGRGFNLMEYMGDYYREYLTKNDLLPPTGCDAAQQFYFWSDIDERDIETGRALASRMFRNCEVTVHRGPAGKKDPLFSGTRAAKASDLPDTLPAKYQKQLTEMQRVLTPNPVAGKKQLVGPGPSADVLGTFKAGYEIADMFLLEYTEGMKPQDVGWGRVTKSNLVDFMQVYQAYVDLTLRNPDAARTNGSNLMSHILKSMQQAAGHDAVPGSLGKPGDKGLVFLGHDSNESYLSGLLGTSWQAEGYQANSRPPGSALIFELWKDTGSGKYSVHSWFVTQSLDQMRNSVPLSLQRPPVRVPVKIAGCQSSECDWDTFRNLAGAAIDPSFVSNAPLAEAPAAQKP